MSDVEKRLLAHFKASKPITRPKVSTLKKTGFNVNATLRNGVWKAYQDFLEETEFKSVVGSADDDNSDNKLNHPDKKGVSSYKVNTPFKRLGTVYKSTIEITDKTAEELGDLVSKV